MKYQYSYSRLSLYENCHAAFKYKCIEKIAEISNNPALVGVTCHKILEEYIIRLKLTKRQIDLDFLMELVSRAVSDATIDIAEDIKLIMTRTAESFMLPKFDTFIDTEKRYAFDTNWNIVDWYDENVFIRGIMDITYDQDGCLVIEDFKSTRKIMSEGEMKNNMQVLLYALMLSKVHDMSKYKSFIRVRMNFIRYGVVREVEIPLKRLEYMETKMLRLVQKIEDTQRFQPRICQFCDWCSYKGICSLYKRHLSNFNIDPGNLKQLAKKVYIAEKFIKESKKILKGHVDTDGAIKVGNMVLDFYLEDKTSFDTEYLIEEFKTAEIAYIPKLTFSKAAIISLTKKDKDLRKKLLETGTTKSQTKFKFKEKE